MLCAGWDLFVHRNFQQVGRVSDWLPYTFLATIDWQKNIKLRDTNYFTPPPLLSLLFLSSLSSTSDFAMYIRKPRISGAVLVEARSMTYGDLGAKALLSVLVAVSH